MAGEITYQDPGAQTGLPLYAVVETVGGLILAGANPEAFDASHWASDFPAAAPGHYYREVYYRAGASPAATDAQVANDYPTPYVWAGNAGPADNSGLSARQLRFFTCECTVWRPFYSVGINKQEQPAAWLPQVTGLKFKIGPRPSQYELQDFILSEGDNIFTLDVLHFGLAADVKPEDVLQVTAGPALLSGGWWKVRGDLQPLTTFANTQKFIAARLPQAPAGITA
jgi:hypothetical protein